jgi:hypothetical protein
MNFDPEFSNYVTLKHLFNAEMELQRNMGRTIKSITPTTIKRKRKRDDLIEDNNRLIFMDVAKVLDEFLVEMILQTVSIDFKVRLAKNLDNRFVNDLLNYYTEFKKIMIEIENAFQSNNIQYMFEIFKIDMYKLLINYHQTLILFGASANT